MNVSQVKKIMQKYGKAWEKQDTPMILECFTKNGAYQESPLAKPYRGHSQIKKFWDTVIGRDTKNIRFRLGDCYVSKDGKTGFAEWVCDNTHRWEHDKKWRRDHMVGITILKMKGNKISYLNEYWKTKSSKPLASNAEKLVRDRIPQTDQSKYPGQSFRKATKTEYWKKLKEKLGEETAEFLESEKTDELADILEVVYAIGQFKKISSKKLDLIRKKKLKIRGGFSKRVILITKK
ncbi:MAG: nuclear transport factor 2 family protein [Candidatus Micrarchaeota archaeon]